MLKALGDGRGIPDYPRGGIEKIWHRAEAQRRQEKRIRILIGEKR
jgi:hypothetical protein